jgi:hypothetical protein
MHLTEVFLQAAVSRIIFNRHRINQGQMLKLNCPDEDNSSVKRSRKSVTGQVLGSFHDRRRDLARFEGSLISASIMDQPCFLAVEMKERMVAQSHAPSSERKPPEIFWRSFIMRPSRSA